MLSRSPIDLAAIDLASDGTMWLRIEGEEASLDTTTSRIQRLLGQGEVRASATIVDHDAAIWQPLEDGSFASADDRLVRAPITPSRLLAVDASLEELTVRRRYSVAGNVVWIVWPASRPMQQLDESLRHFRIGGKVLTGVAPKFRLGLRPSVSMDRRVKLAVDPHQKFFSSP